MSPRFADLAWLRASLMKTPGLPDGMPWRACTSAYDRPERIGFVTRVPTRSGGASAVGTDLAREHVEKVAGKMLAKAGAR